MGFFDAFGDILGKALPFIAPVPYFANKLFGDAIFGGGDKVAQQQLIAPPLPADATDEEIRKAVLMQRRRLLLGQGQGSTFISGSMGDTSSFGTAKSSAGGF